MYSTYDIVYTHNIYIHAYSRIDYCLFEPAEANQTEPFNSGTGRNRTRKRSEPNRTEPRHVRKMQANIRSYYHIIVCHRIVWYIIVYSIDATGIRCIVHSI